MAEEKLHDLVLSIVSDDYENIAQIEKQANECAAEIGVKVSRGDIENALRKLIAQGDVSSFLLDRLKPDAEAVMLDSKPMSELWFYATKDGRKRARSLAEISNSWSST